MKKTLLGLTFALALTLLSGTAVNSAMASEYGIYVAPKVAWSHVSMDHNAVGSDSSGPFFTMSGGDNDNVFFGGLALGYDFYTKFEVPLRAEVEYMVSLNELEAEASALNIQGIPTTVKSELDIQTLFFNVYYDFHNESQFTPYIGGGVGFARLELDSDSFIDGASWLSASEKETNFAWNLGAGCSYAVSDTISFDLNYRYSDLGDIDASTRNAAAITSYKVEMEDIRMHQVILSMRVTF